MENPFQYSGLVGDESYLPRVDVESKLIDHFKSHQNLLVQGPRRIGKTSAIMNTFQALQKKRKCYFIHADFYGLRTLADVRDKLRLALEILPLSTQFRKGLRKEFSKITGMQAFGIGVNWSGEQREQMLEDILMIFSKINELRPLVVFLDEFQSLLDTKYSLEILGRLRSEIQKQPKVLYIYAGSDRARLREIFFVEKNPFFKSAALMDVGSIPRDLFIPWLTERFAMGKRTVDDSIWTPLFNLVSDVPGDIQHYCHTLWTLSKPGSKIGHTLCEKATDYLINMQEKSFIDFWNVISENQRRLLRGLALFPDLGHSSNQFIQKSNLSSSSASSKALDSMLTRGTLWKAGEQIIFSNPFMRLWLMRQENR